MDLDMDQFFNNWDTADSYAALAITLIGFLFGLLIGYLLRGSSVRRLKDELEEANEQLVLVRREMGAMKDQLDQKETDLQRINYDLVEMTGRVDALEEEKAKMLRDVYHTNQELEKQLTANRAYQATIENLNQQIDDFDDERETHTVIVEESENDTEVIYPASSVVVTDNDSLGLEATNQRLERFEAKLARLETENEALRKQIQDLHPHEIVVESNDRALDANPLIFEIDDVEEEPELKVVPENQVINKKIIVDEIEKDDLTKIEGVGPFLQAKLNDIGIYTYAQIADWNAGQIAEVTEEIGYFPGRIEKDNWVGQARSLFHIKQTNPDALVPPPPSAEDLKVIEGIGPKIEQLLKEAGINTWHDLAETDLERLQAILATAGERYRIHDPGTWSQQALLAANGKWEDLREMQEDLKGGRKV